MNSIIEQVEQLRLLLMKRATGEHAEPQDYKELRSTLLSTSGLSERLPTFIRTCRNLDDFWSHIKGVASTYQERRAYLRDQFGPSLDFLESRAQPPHANSVNADVESLGPEYVTREWTKALERTHDDPEAAITSARALVETVCKEILRLQEIDAPDSWDLPKLYRRTADTLNLAPSQHTEEVFKRILGGCQSVVEGIGSLRNRLGDAHGKTTNSPRPRKRHADLVVNLAGATAAFLVATYDEQRR